MNLGLQLIMKTKYRTRFFKMFIDMYSFTFENYFLTVKQIITLYQVFVEN